MKFGLLILLVWVAAIAAPPASAAMIANDSAESGYFSPPLLALNKPPANNQCGLRKDFLSGWLAAWRNPAAGYSANRPKEKTDCANDEWLNSALSSALKSANFWLIIGRELLLRSLRNVSMSIH